MTGPGARKRRLRKERDQRQRRAAAERAAFRLTPEGRRREAAHYALRVAVRDGVLVRPDACSMCGTTEKRIVAHHEDYDKPLEVIWLCDPCHLREIHAMPWAGQS